MVVDNAPSADIAKDENAGEAGTVGIGTPPSRTITHGFPPPTEAKRIRTFASFFKSYMSIWTLVVAALPIPVAAFKLIPTFEEQRKYLSVYTSLFCFLSLAFIFFLRHRIGYYMLGRVEGKTLVRLYRGLIRLVLEWLPLVFIILSVAGVFGYNNVFEHSIVIAQAEAVTGDNGTLMSAFSLDMADMDWETQVVIADQILNECKMTAAALKGKKDKELTFALVEEAKKKAERYMDNKDWDNVRTAAKQYTEHSYPDIFLEALQAQSFIGTALQIPPPDTVIWTKQVPFSSALVGWYLTIFVSAEIAFILMALREYLLDLTGITDLHLIGRHT